MKRLLAIVVMSLLPVACDDPVDPLANAHVEVVSGGAQQGGAGMALPQPIEIRVVDDGGNPISGVDVEWRVIEGGGFSDPARTTTDANGVATTRWTLGNDVGSQALLASTRTASLRIDAEANLAFKAVVAGLRHTCALTTHGEAHCWGANDRGQLGNGAVAVSSGPVVVLGVPRFTALTAGWLHTCGLTVAGEVLCWGDNSVGQAGSTGGGVVAIPRRITSSESFSSVGAGYQHTCAVARSGSIYCWGADDRKTLGAGESTPSCFSEFAVKCTAVPQRAVSNISFKHVEAGEFHSCGIALDGATFCWGWNSDGQTGGLAAGNAMISVPTRVVSDRLYKTLGTGARHLCAITTQDVVECWGRNAAGENGVEPFTSLGAPAPLPTQLRFVQVDGGETHTCALATDQRVYCWGSLLGNGTSNASRTPTLIAVAEPMVAVGAGGDHACAVAGIAVWCWGSNSNRQLGVADVTRSNAPVRVRFGP